MAVARKSSSASTTRVPELGYQGGLYRLRSLRRGREPGPVGSLTLAASVDSLDNRNWLYFTPMGDGQAHSGIIVDDAAVIS